MYNKVEMLLTKNLVFSFSFWFQFIQRINHIHTIEIWSKYNLFDLKKLDIWINVLFFLPFQEIVETTTVPEITTVAEIIEEGDSDGDDSVRLKII